MDFKGRDRYEIRVMTKKLKIPAFQTAEEETTWFAEHDAELGGYFGPPVKRDVSLAEQLGLPPRKKTPTKLVSQALEDAEPA